MVQRVILKRPSIISSIIGFDLSPTVPGGNEAAIQRYFPKYVIMKISQYSQENTGVGVSF